MINGYVSNNTLANYQCSRSTCNRVFGLIPVFWNRGWRIPANPANRKGLTRDELSLVCRNEATRTPDPYVPNVVRYQLRYIPIPFRDSGVTRNRTGDTRIFSPLLYQLSYDTIALGLRVQR